MITCCVCGKGFKTSKEDSLIYGCTSCHKGFWQSNVKNYGLTHLESGKSPYTKTKVMISLSE
jgi:hypothetical protein